MRRFLIETDNPSVQAEAIAVAWVRVFTRIYGVTVTEVQEDGTTRVDAFTEPVHDAEGTYVA